MDTPLVRLLLREQHPDLADLPVRLVGEGWDNVTHRVGSDLATRIPRRRPAVPLLLNERRWLPVLAERLQIAVPTPVRVGLPSHLLPQPWHVVDWIPGDTADREALRDDQAVCLATELKALHQPAPPAAPRNPLRGEPLRTRAAFAQDRIRTVPGLAEADRRRLLAIWDDGTASDEARRRVWIHGDLHPKNVVVRDGILTGILDWGDMSAGDAATDLAAAWTLFKSPAARARFWSAYDPDTSSVIRARAWAVLFGAGLACSGDPEHERVGRGLLGRVLDEERT